MAFGAGVAHRGVVGLAVDANVPVTVVAVMQSIPLLVAGIALQVFFNSFHS